MIGAYSLMPVHERALLPIWMSVIVTVLILVGATLYALWAVGRSDFPMLQAAQ